MPRAWRCWRSIRPCRMEHVPPRGKCRRYEGFSVIPTHLEQLREMGLLDKEIAVLSRLLSGESTREAAYAMELSHTQVMRLRDSGLAKIEAAGHGRLDIPKRKTPVLKYASSERLARMDFEKRY